MPSANRFAFRLLGEASGPRCASARSSASWPLAARPSYMRASPTSRHASARPRSSPACSSSGMARSASATISAGGTSGWAMNQTCAHPSLAQPSHPAVSGRARRLERLGIDLARAGVVGGALERLADQRQQLEPLGRISRQQVAGPRQQVDGVDVLAGAGGTPAGRAQPARGPLRKRARTRRPRERARRDSGAPARGDSRAVPPAPPPDRAGRPPSSWRSARAARPAPAWSETRRPRRGSARAGRRSPPRRSASSRRPESAPCARATRAPSPSPARSAASAATARGQNSLPTTDAAPTS